METLTRAWSAEVGPPAGGSGTPEAVAEAALYLAESTFTHGAVVDDGRVGVAVLAG